MGACNSSVGQNLEKRCQLRRKKRAGSASSSSSSSSSSSFTSQSSSVPKAAEEKNAEVAEATEAAATANQVIETEVDTEKEVGKEEENQAKEEQVEREENSKKVGLLVPIEEAENRKKRFEKLKEGVDFIETEEDAEAVESAVVKIQSTFRGKKIRSKLGQNKQTENNNSSAGESKSQQQQQPKAADSERAINQVTGKAGKSKDTAAEEEEQQQQQQQLNEQVAGMQVNDNKLGADASCKDAANAVSMEQEEAQRAATKIQAGFKGYKTRKELEGKLSGGSSQGGGSGGTCEEGGAGAETPADSSGCKS